MTDTDYDRSSTKGEGGGAFDTLLDRLISEAEADTAQSAAQSAAETAQVSSQATGAGGASLLGGLFSNPAMLSALPGLMNSLGPLLGGGASGGGKGGILSSALRHPDRHTALLCALKPYLSNERRQAAEHMIQLCRVWTALQGMGGSPASSADGKPSGGSSGEKSSGQSGAATAVAGSRQGTAEEV